MESMKKRTPYYTSKVIRKLALKFMKNALSMEEIEKMDMPQDAYEALMLNIEAYKYVIQYEESGKKYVSERLRTAYIGEEVSDYAISNAIQHVPIAGREMTQFIADLLKDREPQVPPEDRMITARNIKIVSF